MNNYKITTQVKKKTKKSSKWLGRAMIILAIICLAVGIIMDRGFMLIAFLFALLYFIFNSQTEREYEYSLENGVLTIDVIKGKRRRKTAHVLYLKDMEVVAPNWHSAVAQYRKDGGTVRLPKFDYTSYEDDIPYYTMIIMQDKQKIKLLLDLSREMLELLKKTYPQKVYLQ